MEILNKNKRRRALWRLAGLWVLILACIVSFLYAAQVNYANQGVSELQRELIKMEMALEKEKGICQGLKNSQLGMDSEIAQLKKQLEDKEDDLKEIKAKLREVEGELRRKEELLFMSSKNQ